MKAHVIIVSLIFVGGLVVSEEQLSKANTFVYESGVPDQRCPRVDDPRRPVHMQHPYDCTKFYKCFDGRAYQIDCPAGQHWGASLNRCDLPNLARCERSYSLPVEASEKSNTFVYAAGVPDQRCPRVDDPRRPIHMQHPYDCTKFYKCFDGRVYQIDCPAGQHWGVSLNRCDLPNLARCERSYSLPVEASEKSNTFVYAAGVPDQRCPRVDDPRRPIHMQHPYDCTKFYKCFDGRAYQIDCPAGQHWGASLNRCDLPNLARCERSYSLPVEASEKSNTFVYAAGVPDQRCPRVDDPRRPIHMQHPYDCTKFYKCFDGRAYQIDCPAGQHWGASLNRCDLPSLARCERSYSLPVEASEKSNTFVYAAGVPDQRCPRVDDPRRPIHMQHPYDCTKFYKCFDGRAYQIDCPAGQHWGASLNRCDLPNLARCERSYSLPVEASEKSNTFVYAAGVPDQRCPRVDDPRRPIHMQHPYDCTKFYKCFDGRAYQIDCPAGQHWGASLNRCDLPNLARCDTSYSLPVEASEKANTFLYESGIPDQRCPRNDNPFNPIHMPHAYDCNKFYKCFNGRAYALECPAGQQWAAHLNRCEHPSRAHCGDSTGSFDDFTDMGNTFIYEAGVPDQRCPRTDNPRNPIHLQHPYDCTKFYKCFNGRTYTIDCPAGQEWGASSNRCEFPSVSQCRYRYSDDGKLLAIVKTSAAKRKSTDVVEIEPEMPQIEALDTNEVMLLENTADVMADNFAVETISSYVLSDEDEREEMEKRGVFDFRCPATDSFEPLHLPHKSDCRKFYKCFAQRAFLITCPAEQHWSVDLNRCEYPESANCRIARTE